jgi:iron complex outermembrane recepter protein
MEKRHLARVAGHADWAGRPGWWIIGPDMNRLLQTSLWFLTGATVLGAGAPPGNLAELSLEELLNIEVTSVSRKAEKLSQAPAAVHVITGDDIRRSGATSIPEALRLAPGVQVARLDTHSWAVSVRGFNSLFANKLLVMIDGRSVYTPLFSGVFWEQREVMLEDVDRIEVVRGPGADLWGANAVNGVINIITKSAQETQGMLVTGGGGSEERGFGAVRYGAKAGENTWYRAFVKYSNRDEALLPSGAAANDGWYTTQGGFRVDWEPDEGSRLTVTADAREGKADQTFRLVSPAGVPTPSNGRLRLAGQHVMARWQREFSDDSSLDVHAYFDRTDRGTPVIREERNTADFSFEHRLQLGQRHELGWGVGYRHSRDRAAGTFSASLSPNHRSLDLFSGFIRDRITLKEDHLWLLLGTHLEHNDLSGAEVQPSARLLWTPSDRHTLWTAVSRAVRTPSRAEHDVTINQPGSALPGSIDRLIGSRTFGAEELLAYQAGWNVRLHERVALAVTGFYNDYDRLLSLEPAGVTFVPPPPVVSFTGGNGLAGETYGFELGPQWQVTDRWRLQASYSWIDIQLHRRPGSAAALASNGEGQTPHHQFALISNCELPRNVNLGWTLRYVDDVPSFNISSYVEMDVRLAWRPRSDLELAIVGQNLLDNSRPEFGTFILPTVITEVQRGVYGKITWRF